MTITCTITKAGRADEYGRPLLVGQSYTGVDAFVESLYMSGYATVSNVNVFDDDEFPNGRTPVLVALDNVTSGSRYVVNDFLVSGEWVSVPAVFKLLLNGTGAVTLDSRDPAGVVTTGVFTTTLASAVNQAGFPYAGDTSVAIRATFPTTATVKVI